MENNIFSTINCNQKKYKLLMVDDSKSFNQKITDSLRAMGHEVTQSYTLKDTIELIKNKDFDFIFLDLILPDGEGDEVIDILPEEEKAKIIVLSGDTDMQRRNHIFSSGILDYFSKTNPTNIIIQDIKNLLCSVQYNKNVNILAVDDSGFMRRLIKSLLAPKQYNVLEAADGQEALDILEKTDIHLMLCDLEMPVMDGVKLVEKVKNQTKYLELPIIMISSKDDKSLIARVLKHGARDFIKKPFSTEEFLLKCDLHVKDHLNVEFLKHKELQLQEALKQAKEAQEHKSMFLANMSHEIRTPLNAIVGFVDILLEDEISEKKLDYLSNIHNSGEHLQGLINDILDFSKIESNKLDIVIDIINIEKLIESIKSINKQKAKEKNIDLHINLSHEVPQNIKSDFLRLKQILTNLVGNAIKFTPHNGKVTVNISIKEDEQNIKFEVIDTGIGIAKENHEKVFKLFSQAESTTTKNFGGTGLGLSISTKLVQLLGGEKIGIESELNKGAKFYFELPLEQITKEEQEKEVSTTKINLDDNFQFDNHILIVEDNKMNQQLISIILKKMGFSFDIASDGNEGIELYKQNSYDLVLMDENMPNMNGSEAVGIIRKYEQTIKKHTPVIALTANAIKGDRERFLSAGMDEYITKPVKKDILFEMFDKFLIREDYEKRIFEEPKENSFTLEDAIAAIKQKDISQAQKILEKLNIKDLEDKQ